MTSPALTSSLVDAVSVWGLQAFDAHCCAHSIAACSGYGPRVRRVEYTAGASRTPRYGDADFGVRCGEVERYADWRPRVLGIPA